MSELDTLRAEIERIDRAIVHLLAARVRTAYDARGVKRAAGIPTVDPAREAAVIRHASALARRRGLDPEGVRDVFWAIVQLSRDSQLSDAADAG